MVPVSPGELTPEQQEVLLDIAERSIRHGLDTGRALAVDLSRYDAALRAPRATFVTLRRDGALRGCVGALAAYQPLAQDVADHAFAAAFLDTRFLPLRPEEVEGLEVSISILSEPQTVTFRDEQDLLRQLRPGVDGLILEHGARRGTFLPSVWEQLPRPVDFWRQLKRKAGLPESWWSDEAHVQRYTTAHVGPRRLTA